MKYQFFIVPVLGGKPAQDELNAFQSSRRIVHVDRQFVADGARSCWAFCVGYEPSPKIAVTDKRIDYREVLNERDFGVYSKLRTLRKQIAEQEGAPVYAVFTNEQLAAMVQRRVLSKNQMAAIEGVGQSRMEKYVPAFLNLLQREWGPGQTTEGTAVGQAISVGS